ncbi:hypothetical protein [Tardiphaga sp. 813_E8_N1_3]|uniref:hypothetical protein n=1 Tax=Tardiphaga sp. 813_E8_N1_3 TaxID=3240760 RepID=UPI003F253D47
MRSTVTSDDEAIFRQADKEIKDLHGQEASARAHATMDRATRTQLIETIRGNIRQVREGARRDYRKIKEDARR